MNLRVPDDHVPPSADRWPRRDYADHRARVRAANRARGRAIRILIDENPDEYDAYLIHFGALEDPPVRPTGRHAKTEAERVEAQIKRLKARLRKLEGEGDG